MKSLIAILIFIPQLLQAQIPAYFTNGREWSHIHITNELDTIKSKCFVYYVNGDTTLNGKSYTILGKRTRINHFSNSTFLFQTLSDTANYRYVQQVNDSIIEFNTNNSVEELLISYNLNIGDVFDGNLIPSIPVQSITNMDVNGQTHRVFHLDTNNWQYVIEGIGHIKPNISGFIDSWYSSGTQGQDAELLHYGENGTIYWDNPYTWSNCGFLHNLSVEQNRFGSQLHISPNPNKGQANIKSDQIIESVELMSIDGVFIEKLEINSFKAEIRMTNLHNGVYLLIVKYANGQVQLTRILKI